MTDNRCGIDFLIEDGEEEKILEMEPETPGVDLEIAGTDAAELEAAGSEEPTEMELPEDEEPAELDVGDAVIVHESLPVYDGPVTVVPSPWEQVLETRYTSVMDRITVAPIPKNYGLITYNGRTITVS